MNKPITFELAKLLKEKGLNKDTLEIECNQGYDFRASKILQHHGRHIQSHLFYSAPTIAEVVMWLYEKHGIWIVAFPELFNGTEVRFYPSMFEQGVGEDIEQYFNSPSETYEAAIKYCLEKII